MIGAIIGDVVGSRFEFFNHKSKDFEFFHERCSVTDDSVMTIAVANALMVCDDYSKLGEVAIREMVDFGRMYPDAGYGAYFISWIFSNVHEPDNSFGNGAAMRISPVGFVAKTLDEVKELSHKITEISHNHPEGLKGAEATAVAIFLARQGKTIPEIRDYINKHYYKLDFTLDDIRDSYFHVETCQETVPQAITAFLESTSFEDAIRNAISVGGDSDTIAAITGGIAEAYYGIPEKFIDKLKNYLDETFMDIISNFQSFKFGIKRQ